MTDAQFPSDPGDAIVPLPLGAGWSADDGADVGSFAQGSPVSRWALARYLVGRAVAESISRSLLLLGLALLLAAAGVGWGLSATFWGVLIAIVALAVLAMRAVLTAILDRLTAAKQVGPLEQRLRAVVNDTRSDVLRELRRLGLPGRTWTLPLFAVRFAGRERRARTIQQLRGFEIENVVPASRLDELHLVLQSLIGHPNAS